MEHLRQRDRSIDRKASESRIDPLDRVEEPTATAGKPKRTEHVVDSSALRNPEARQRDDIERNASRMTFADISPARVSSRETRAEIRPSTN